MVEFSAQLGPPSLEHHPSSRVPDLPGSWVPCVGLVHQKVDPKRYRIACLERRAHVQATKAPKPNVAAMVAPWPRHHQYVHPCNACYGSRVWLCVITRLHKGGRLWPCLRSQQKGVPTNHGEPPPLRDAKSNRSGA